MKYRKVRLLLGVALAVTAITVAAQEQKTPKHSAMPDCPMMSDAQAAAVDERGDKGMGFSHEKTTHHFRILPDGGAIEVTGNDAADLTSCNQIRMHLGHIAKMFAAGNFQVPMFVHDKIPDGARTMQEMKSKITYTYEELQKGGRVRITTSDPQALAAVHEFLRFQITEQSVENSRGFHGVRAAGSVLRWRSGHRDEERCERLGTRQPGSFHG